MMWSADFVAFCLSDSTSDCVLPEIGTTARSTSPFTLNPITVMDWSFRSALE